MDLLKVATECGATIYRNRVNPHTPAVAFGDEAWAKFCEKTGHEPPKEKPQHRTLWQGEKLGLNWSWTGHPDSNSGVLSIFDATPYAIELRLSSWQEADDLANSISNEIARHVKYALQQQAAKVQAALC